MNIYYNNTFVGHYPVGTCAIIVAPTPEIAADMLNDYLEEIGLQQQDPVEAVQMTRVTKMKSKVIMINDGNY